MAADRGKDREARSHAKRVGCRSSAPLDIQETLTMAPIEARGLRKTFGTTVALDSIDLHVEEGRILGLIGPNGAGKTTALNAILGLTSYERSEEHTSELQSPCNLVCRLLL